LRDNGCDGCSTGVESQGDDTLLRIAREAEHETAITSALKPRRKL
jgi:hypothetical protein